MSGGKDLDPSMRGLLHCRHAAVIVPPAETRGATRGTGRARLTRRALQKWIDTYGAAGFAETVAQVLAVADRTGPPLGVEEDRWAARHFAVTARYEWMFCDAASAT